MCLSSRFHGVASALNSCVLCLATSWTHKYATLFKDYGIKDGMLDITDKESCLNKIETYLNPEHNNQLGKLLCNIIPTIQKKRIMWEKVWETREYLG